MIDSWPHITIRIVVVLVAFLNVSQSLAEGPAEQRPWRKLARVDTRLPKFVPSNKVNGSLRSIGSDTLNNLMTLWGEELSKVHPNLNFEIEGKGSSTAPYALTNDVTEIGPMSRPMKERELRMFKDKHGYEPIPMRVAIDVLAIYVHKDNPIVKRGLTMAEADAIFSSTRKRGHPKDIAFWDELGMTGEWKAKPINMYGRNSASGTYGFFKVRALNKGDFKHHVREQPGSSSVVAQVARDRYGIGYSGIGYMTADVKVVPIIAERGRPDNKKTASASAAIAEGSSSKPPYYTLHPLDGYPLSRWLFVYVNFHAKKKLLSPAVREFYRFVYSREGQSQVVRDGYIPLNADICVKDAKKIGINLKLNN